MANYFSTNLKYLREKRNISRTVLAKMLNVNPSTISRWENNKMGATIDNAIDISNILHIPLSELLGKDLRIKHQDNPNEKKLNEYATKNGMKIYVETDNPITAEDVFETLEYLKDIQNKNNKKE